MSFNVNNFTQSVTLIDHEDQVDDDVQERLTEDHQDDKRRTQETTEELGTQRGATQFTAHHKRIPINNKNKVICNESIMTDTMI